MLTIGAVKFSSQKSACQFVSRLLNKYQPGDWVSDEHAAFLTPLLERHPEYKEKLGVGFDHFEVMEGAHGTQCFRIVRPDGSGTHFSYASCVRGKSTPKKGQVLKALRWAIRDQINAARTRLFRRYGLRDGRLPCAVTKQRLFPHEGHIDHRPPLTFEVLVTTFLGARGMTYDDVPLLPPADDQRDECADAELIEQFQLFHSRTATLDFVAATINLSQASKHRIKKVR